MQLSRNTSNESVLNVSGCYQCTWPHFTLDRSRILNNTGTHAAPVVSGVAVRVSGSTFAGNVNGADAQGGGLVANAGAVIDGTTFSGNEGGVQGGGLIAHGGVIVANSTFNNNHAWYGGAIFSGDGTLTLRNVTIAGNRADRQGGGVFVTGGGRASTVFLSNVTIAGNQTGDYSGGGLAINYDGDIAYLRNSIIAGNTRNGVEDDCGCFTNWVSQGHNVIGYGSFCFIPTTGDITSTSASTPIDPRLGPLQDNGGPTLTRALLTGSPALNGGSPDAPGTDPSACETADQRGVARPQGTACDIGAVEMVPTVDHAPVVTSPGDQTSAEQVPVSLTIHASDQDGDLLGFMATGLPPGLAVDAATGVIAGTVPYGSHGAYSVVVTVSDSQLTASAPFTWTIEDTVPVVAVAGDRTSDVGFAVTQATVAMDADGDTLSYSADGLPDGLSIDPTTGVVSGVPTIAAAYPVTLHANDGFGGTASVAFTWTIRQPAAQTAAWAFTPVAHEQFDCDTYVDVRMLRFDPAARPVLGWTSASGCGGPLQVRWSRRESGGWNTQTIVPPQGAFNKTEYGRPAFTMALDGTPWVVYGAQGPTIVGDQDSWAGTVKADLDQNPTGTVPVMDFVTRTSSCILSGLNYSTDIAPFAASPSFAYATACGGGYEGYLDDVRFDTGVDHVGLGIGPDGHRRVIYTRSGLGIPNSFWYSDGVAPPQQIPLPNYNFRGMDIVVDAHNRMHVAFGGVLNCANPWEGGLVYLTSVDGVTWSMTWIDATSGRGPSIALDGDGNPVIAYWNVDHQVRIAHLVGGRWTTELVHSTATPSVSQSTAVTFDSAGAANVAFFDPDAMQVTIATAPLGQSLLSLAPVPDRTDPLGGNVSIPLTVQNAGDGTLTFGAQCLPPGVSIDPSIGTLSGTIVSSDAGPYSPIISVSSGTTTAATSFTWTMTDSNRPPVAADDTASTFSGSPVTVTVLANDSDPDTGQTLTVTGTSAGPAKGTVVVNGDETITYTPNLGFAGTDTFVYAISDGHGGTASATVTITVTKRSATVTAGSGTKVYGTGDPSMPPSSTGFLPADNITLSQTRAAGESVGHYATTATATGANLANYDVTYTAGDLAITPAPVTVTADAQTKPYGAADPALTYTITNGVLVGTDAFTGALTRAPGETVGTYAIAQGSLALSGNYTLTYAGASLTITKIAASVTPVSTSKTYGTADPAFTGTLVGFLPADGVTATFTRAGGETVAGSPYAISAALSPAGVLTNYTITYNTGNFSITPAPVTVTAGSGTKIYGTADPALATTETGLTAADVAAVTLSSTRAAGEVVADYATTATASGAVLSNYAVRYVAGHFSITPAALTVTADNATKHFGTPNPPFTASYAGLTNGDTATSLLGTLGFSTPATLMSPLGNYPITPSGLRSPNYTITFVNGTLSVTDTAPVCAAAAPTIGQLWPPNHQLVTTGIIGLTDAENDALTVTVTGIRQDEPTNSEGDGNTAIDGFGVGTSLAQVRAERAGTPQAPGDGRVYHIFFTATDPAGLSCANEVKVGVPHDQASGPAVDGGALYDSTVPGGPRVK